MADDVLLTNIKLEGADQVQDDLKRIGDEGARAFERLSQAANQRFDQVSQALVKVSQSLDRMANTRVEINTDRANQALENISRVADQLSRRLETLGQPGSKSLQEFNAAAQRTQGEVRALEGTTVSAFSNISQSGVSAFTLLKNSINDAISTASNYKTAIAGIFTGGAIGFVVSQIQDAVKSFDALKKASSDAKIGFDEYQKLGFTLREIGVSAEDAAKTLTRLGEQAQDLKKKGGVSSLSTNAAGDVLRTTKGLDFGKPSADGERVVKSTGTIVENLTKIEALNKKLAAGGFGAPGSFDAIEKHRAALKALQDETTAAAAQKQPVSQREAFERSLTEQRAESRAQVSDQIDLRKALEKVDDQYIAGRIQTERAYLEARADVQTEFRQRAERRAFETQQRDAQADAAPRGPKTITVPDARSADAAKAVKDFQTKPTAEGLREIATQLQNIGSESKKLELLKQVFGGAEAPAKAFLKAVDEGGAKLDKFNLQVQGLVKQRPGAKGDEANLVAQGLLPPSALDQIIADYGKLARIKATDEENTKALKAANEDLAKAMFEVGFATEQGKISLGLMFAPVLAPAIEAIARGIRFLNLNLRETLSNIGKDIGPAIDQLFNIFKGAEVDTSKTGMFKGLIDGFKGLVDAAQPALDVFNSFFQTSLKLSDIGIGAALAGLVGGFNALAIAIGSVFVVSTPGMENFKNNLKGIGIDVDAIKERVLNFARGLSEAFSDPGQRADMFENIKKSLEGLPAIILGVVAGFALLRTGAGLLGRALGAAFGVKISAEATLLGVALAQISGVLPTINTLASTFAGIMVGLNATMTILVGILGWPLILAAGLVVALTHLKEFEALCKSVATTINDLFGTKITGTEVFVAALVVLGAGLVALVVRIFAAGAALVGFGKTVLEVGVVVTGAMGGFTALLGVLGRITVVILAAVAAWQLWKDVTGTGGEAGALERKMDETTKKFQEGGFGDPKSQEAIEKYRAELNKLQQEFEKTSNSSSKLVDPASTKSLLDQVTSQFEAFMKGIDDLAKKGAESRAKDIAPTGAAATGAAPAGPKTFRIEDPNSPTGFREITTGVRGQPEGTSTAPTQTGPKTTTFPRTTPQPPPEPPKPPEAKKPEPVTQREPTLDELQSQTTLRSALTTLSGILHPQEREPGKAETLPSQAQKTSVVSDAELEAEKAKIHEVLQDLATNAAKEVAQALNVAKERTLSAGGEVLPGNVQDVRKLSPEEFAKFQDASDLVAKLKNVESAAENAANALSGLAKDAGIDAIGKPGPQAGVAPAQQFVGAPDAGAQGPEAGLQTLGPALDAAAASAQSTVQALQPVAPAFEQVSTAAQGVPQGVAQAEQAFQQIDFSQAEQVVSQFVQAINDAFSKLKAPQPTGAATGGLITGPGTDTSDSIPILASANEFMVKAAAVRHYGKDFMYRVNSMSFPRLAMGGLVEMLNQPLSGQIRLPRFAEGGLVGSASQGGVPVHVNFEGKRVFSASASRSSIEQLKRESLMQKVRSGGPSPFWVE